jgi:hypothetical protein
MYPAVSKVFPLSNFVLDVVFDNGERGRLDMSPYLEFGVFKRLKQPDNFQQVKIAFDTVEWECGVDLDPEFVYEKAVKG